MGGNKQPQSTRAANNKGLFLIHPSCPSQGLCSWKPLGYLGYRSTCFSGIDSCRVRAKDRTPAWKQCRLPPLTALGAELAPGRHPRPRGRAVSSYHMAKDDTTHGHVHESNEAHRRPPKTSRQAGVSRFSGDGDRASQRTFQHTKAQGLEGREAHATLSVSPGRLQRSEWAPTESLQSPHPLLKAEVTHSSRPPGSPKSPPGKCHVLSWGSPQKSLLTIMAFGGYATARLASKTSSEARCCITN